jgi:hypothetical protein
VTHSYRLGPGASTSSATVAASGNIDTCEQVVLSSR